MWLERRIFKQRHVFVFCVLTIFTSAAVDTKHDKSEDQVATRERRAAESTFWRRAYSDDSGDTDFWKRVKIGSNNAFWKRDQLKSFWKRLNHDVETVEGDPLQDNERFDFDSDEEALKRNYGKSTDITFGKQQRRGHESSQRRPEFNPTGW